MYPVESMALRFLPAVEMTSVLASSYSMHGYIEQLLITFMRYVDGNSRLILWWSCHVFQQVCQTPTPFR